MEGGSDPWVSQTNTCEIAVTLNQHKSAEVFNYRLLRHSLALKALHIRRSLLDVPITSSQTPVYGLSK